MKPTNNTKWIVALIIVLLAAVAIIGVVNAQEPTVVKLAWDQLPPSEVAAYQIEGYRIYDGGIQIADLKLVDLIDHGGGDIGATVSLLPGIHKLTVKSYSTSGLVSDPSNEVEWKKQPAPRNLRLVIEVSENGSAKILEAEWVGTTFDIPGDYRWIPGHDGSITEGEITND